MTDPTTPRSSRHGTPDINSDGDTPAQAAKTPEIMTPGAKIRAMMAQFDSDSESGNERETAPKPRNTAPPTSTSTTRNTAGPDEEITNLQEDSDDDDDDEENLPVAPRGKLAARMQGGGQNNAPSPPEKTQQTDGSPAQTTKNPPDTGVDGSDDDSEDDVRAAAPKRRAARSSPSPSPSPARSETSRRSASPLFVPAGPDDGQETHNPDDEQGPENTSNNSRFQELVARKRKEREEKERIEEEKREARIQRSSELGIQFSDNEEDDAGDDRTGQKLTQESRPTARKASKKAVLEMNRETQRMSRNMQLAHQATTKKKFTLNDFMARFNRSESKEDSATAPSSHHPSDTEARHPDSTPPTSPPPVNAEGGDLAEKLESQANLNPESGTSEQPAPQSTTEVHTDSVEQEQAQEPAKEAKAKKKSVRVKLSPRAVAQTQNDDSDSDLEVVTSPSKARKLAIFENLTSRKAHQSQSLQTLRALANLTGSNRHTLSEMNQADLEATLFRKAREQATEEREEKIRRLREKGVVIQTAEERNKTENDVEDLMQKAREEAESIAKKEKAAAKRNGEEGGDALDDDSDEDYDGDQGEPDEEEIDSEADEDADDEGEDADEDEKVQVKQSSDLLDNQAEETGESESEAGDDSGAESEPEEVKGTSRRAGRKKLVVSDDEDEDEEPAVIMSTPGPKIPNLGKTSGDFFGLSQAFAATLATSQDETEQDSLAKLREMPDVELPATDILEPDSQGIIRDSQDQQSGSLDLLGNFTQTGAGIADSPSARTFTQYSQAPEPTQDEGFVMSPFDQQRFAEHPFSTIDTVALDPEETPLGKKGTRRLRRGGQQAAQVSDDEEVSTDKNAFEVMRKKAKKTQTPYDRKKSKAKDIVDEAAEESEDEFAGLGGGSDEDSGAEDDYDRAMINDQSGEVVNEKELAALNADFDRERDERDVNKLMKDITTGGLRRKRAGGDDFDLSESDDERAEARRRAKRREFAKMRKALLSDDKLSKMADDPKKAAFLRSIEDRDFGDDMDFLADEDAGDNGVDIIASQENSSAQEGQDGAQTGRKRPLDTTSGDTLNRPPAKLRRKAAMKKPTSLAEIRQSVSFLLDGPETEPTALPSDDKEPEEQDDEDELSRSDTTVRRDAESNDARQPEVTYNNPRRSRGAVVDRLSLRRAASSNATSAASKQAFYTSASGSGSASPSFNGPPPLLSRKSTTAISTVSTATSLSSNSNSNTGKSAITGSGSGAGGGKKAAAVNYYAAARDKAREAELKRKDEERRERKLGLGAMKSHGDRLRGLLGGQKSGQWE